MALKDIRSTRSRVDELRSIRDQIDLVCRGSNDVQKYYDRALLVGGNDIKDIHTACLDRLVDLDGILAQAYADLAAFRTNGMVFKYRWQAGKGNIRYVKFTTTQTLELVDIYGDVLTTGWCTGTIADVFAVGDIVKIENAEVTSNNGNREVSVITDQTITFLNIQGAATLTDASAIVTLWARA
jgi:hypothetical protein